MNAAELIQEARTSGVTLTPLPNGRLQATGRPQVPSELKARLREHKAEVLALLTGTVLAEAYRQYWATPEDDPKIPLETFAAILAEIGAIEAELEPCQAIQILETEARRFHRETGICPYCRFAGPLHHQGEPDGQERLL